MAGPSKLNGALRWSAAEEVAVRISAVRSQVSAAASGEGEMGKQLRSGLNEIDSIRKFIHDGINMCNRQYLDAGTRDSVLQTALEKGLSELEDVRGKLVSALHTHAPSHQNGGDSAAAAAAASTSGGSAMRRPPSAPVRSSVQREIDAKKQQRAVNEQQRKSFLDRMSASTNVVGADTAATKPPGGSRPTSATQRAPSAQVPGQGLKGRPTSATVRTSSVDNSNNNTNHDGIRPTATPWGTNNKQSGEGTPQPAPPERRGTLHGTTTQSASTSGLKFRPSSAPYQRTQVNGDNAATAAGGGARQQQSSEQQAPTDDEATGSSAWGKYQDWAQSVLSRVQSRRVMQHRQAMQRQRETDRQDQTPPTTPSGEGTSQSGGGGGASQVPPRGTTTAQSTSAPSAGNGPPLAQNIVQGNLRRPRPSTAGLTPSGVASSNTNTGSTGGPARPQSAKLNPQAQMFREQGNVLFQQKKYRESAEAYSRAIECDPHSETLYCNRAAASLMLGKYLDALQDSLKAIEFDPIHVKAHWRAAKSYLYLGQSDDARSMYQQAQQLASIQTETDAIDAEKKAVEWVDKAKRCIKGREWQDGLRWVEQVLDVFPPSGPCSMPWQCLRAEAMIHVDAHEACNLLSQMTTDDPTSAEAWYLRAKGLFYTGHDGVSTNTCVGYLQKSRELDASNRSASLQLCIETFAKLRDEGNSAYSGGRWLEAHSAYTRCLSVDPYNTSLKAIILCNRAAVSIQCEKWKDALDDINQSIAFNPHNAKAYTRRARIYQHNNQFDLAVKDLQLAVQMYPSAENQERLTQAVEMKNQSTRQQAQKQQQQQQQQPNGAGGSFRYFGFASGAGGASFQNGQSRPSTAGTRRPQSAGYGGESSNHSNYFNGGKAGNNNNNNNNNNNQVRAKSYYEILCITKTVDEKGVVRAYRDAALKWHPDKWASATAEQKANAEAVFKEVSLAYNTLKDPQKRRQYDLSS
ncbi:Hypothetical protein, putative [Bodo saltans]|uniref:J domain-containing protein n=1 Tax=Bodo saltans TaxID=75058 RepID=A0A0S4JSA3_BODSA|nr:Hypothetical protein, putative [Bodo saltans]|eukprot:CUG94364.1 Hypothetical protein, putative [Bodo saltans]